MDFTAKISERSSCLHILNRKWHSIAKHTLASVLGIAFVWLEAGPYLRDRALTFSDKPSGHQGAKCQKWKYAISRLSLVRKIWKKYGGYLYQDYTTYCPRLFFDLFFKVTEVKMCWWCRHSTIMASFLTALVRDLKLSMNVPLDDSYSETELWPFQIHHLATRGPNVKSENKWYLTCYWSEKYEKNIVGLQRILSAFIFWPSFQGHRGQNVSVAPPFNKYGMFRNCFSQRSETWWEC